MANGIYDKAREEFLGSGLDFSSDTIKVVAVDTAGYAVNLAAADPVLNDIGGSYRIATSGALASKTITGGVADADDITFSSVTGASIEALVIYKDTGNVNTSRLIAYIDTATGLPVTPNGGNITVTWDNGANKIFKL